MAASGGRPVRLRRSRPEAIAGPARSKQRLRVRMGPPTAASRARNGRPKAARQPARSAGWPMQHRSERSSPWRTRRSATRPSTTPRPRRTRPAPGALAVLEDGPLRPDTYPVLRIRIADLLEGRSLPEVVARSVRRAADSVAVSRAATGTREIQSRTAGRLECGPRFSVLAVTSTGWARNRGASGHQEASGCHERRSPVARGGDR
jgi:hypothetical protein